MSDIKPLVLYSHRGTPNPFKAALFLEELGLPYTVEDVGAGLKEEPYISINPNGRAPSLADPNTGVTIFESGAIIEYLIETYDKENRLNYTTSPEKFLLKSWLFFQVSGQGPYYGQKAWFSFFHSEKIPSAVERYDKEIRRVTKVLNDHLKKNGTGYLVGDKLTYADLSFIPWQNIVHAALVSDWDYEAELPEYAAWWKKISALESWKRVTSHPDLKKL